jgi:hypothetical protein
MRGTWDAHFTRGASFGTIPGTAMTGPGFSKELRDAAAARDVVPRLGAERPEEWRLGPLTVVLDARAGTAQLRYARLPVARAAGEAAAIMAAWTRALAQLERRSLPPDQFLPLLATTYAHLVTQSARAPGDRLALPALREHVAKSIRGYTRTQFAWDLARLRRERRLVHEGLRIDLGVATGHAAARSSRVVWVEDESGAGQYYETFRMLKEPPR